MIIRTSASIAVLLMLVLELAAQTPPAQLPPNSGIQAPASATDSLGGDQWRAPDVGKQRAVASLSSSDAPSLDAHKVQPPQAAIPVRSGGKELALELEEKGYAWLEKEPVA